MKFTYSDGGREAAGFRGTAGDCVCRAVSIASGLPYIDVYKALAAGHANQREPGGRKNRRTARDGIKAHRVWFQEFMRLLGFEWHPLHGAAPECATLPAGRLVLDIYGDNFGHYSAVIDREIFDTCNHLADPGRRLHGYWLLRHEISPAALKKLRLEAGLTQSEAAAAVGVTLRAWQYWEAGQRKMPDAAVKLFRLITTKNGPPPRIDGRP